jgi:hypothetical protein
MDPCPKSRIEKNPTKSHVISLTKLIPKHANPNIMAKAGVMYLCPHLSKNLPTKPISKPAINVPIEYKPETVDRLHPKSLIYESINVETL